jgi:molybdenum cofactor cytidylyltransferase
MTRDRTRRVLADGGGPDETRTVGAVLLAAGQSTRFEDGNKLVTDVDGRPLVRHAAETLLATDLAGPVVVLGHQPDAVREALAGLALEFVVNEDYADGQSTSVAVGVTAARDRGWDAAVFALGDMPDVAPETVERVVDTYRAGDASVVAPAYDGIRGNPVLFDRQYFDALADVRGDRGGRDIVEESGTLVEVADPGVRRDVDRRADLDAE